MAKITVHDLVRLVEEELEPSLRIGGSPVSGEGAEDERDWEMLCRLGELWRVHNPKLRGDRVSHRRFLGLPVLVVKRAFRVLFQPFINEILDRQTVFNQNMVGLADLHRDTLLSLRRKTEADREKLEARIERLEKALGAAERGGPDGAAREKERKE